METIPKMLREQPTKDDQIKTVDKVIESEPETLLDWEPIKLERVGF